MRRLILSALCLASGTVSAATTIFVKPVTASVANLATPYSVEASDMLERAINGNGLNNANLVETGAVVPNLLTAGPIHIYTFNPNTFRIMTSTNEPNVNGHGNSVTSGLGLVFDLGAAYEVSGMWFWNYMEGSGATLDRRNRGLDSIKVEFSVDGITWTHAQTVSPAIAAESGHAQEISFSALGQSSRYIRFSELSNFGTVLSDTGPGADKYLGFSEVRFTATIPEPSRAVLSFSAITLFTLRRRRKAAVENKQAKQTLRLF